MISGHLSLDIFCRHCEMYLTFAENYLISALFHLLEMVRHMEMHCEHGVSDTGDVKGKMTSWGPLLHLEDLAHSSCHVCFKRIAFTLFG